MKRIASLAAAALMTVLAGAALAQDKPAAKPMHETIKVEGTEGVYIFRYGNVQSMFVVTPAGVIATDPIGYARPEASAIYVEEIRKITKQPIKYLVYSHHHFDHITGGQVFKDAGAKIVAHQKVKQRLAVLKDPRTPLPDETFTQTKTLKLGGTTLELHYLGLNHSDSTLVMRLPKERVIFTVDWVPVGSLPGRAMIFAPASLKTCPPVMWSKWWWL